MSYDALDRLTTATSAATDGYGTITYTYNQIGNMLSHSKVGTYTYNASGASSTRPHAVARTRLTTGSTTTYSYDANGNLVSGGGRTLTWDYENRPTQIVKGGVTTTFKYDGDGGRVKKTVSPAPHATVYIGQLYVCEGTACTRLIYAGSQRVAMVQVNSGAISYFHGDHLGSTSVVTDSTGTEEEHNSYRPYGDLQAHTGTSDVAYKYTGQERDASTALYFYQARYYAQGLGRFVSPDTLVPNYLDPQAFNRYAYARNNPLRYTDPTGHWWWDPPLPDPPLPDLPDWPPWDPPLPYPDPQVPMLPGVDVTAPSPGFLSPYELGPWGEPWYVGSELFFTLIGGAGGFASGAPLPPNVMKALTPYFEGFNLNQVRVWQGLPWYVMDGIDAYTSNYDIYFAPGAYNTTTARGIALIGHEVLHVQQYEIYGPVGFRLRYLWEYAMGRLSGLGHQKAYESISFERDAFALEKRIREAPLR